MTEHNGGYVVGWFVKNELVEKFSAVRERMSGEKWSARGREKGGLGVSM
jgi:hypothetical protein